MISIQEMNAKRWVLNMSLWMNWFQHLMSSRYIVLLCQAPFISSMKNGNFVLQERLMSLQFGDDEIDVHSD